MLPDMVRQHLLRIGSRFHIQILQALDRLLIEIPGIEIDPSGNVHSTPSTQYTEYFKANGYHFSKGNGPVPCW